MRQISYVVVILTAFFYSCDKNSENINSKYELYGVPKDTSLYISYYKDGIYFKYFQIKDDFGSISPLSYSYDKTKDLFYYSRYISFDRLVTDNDYFNVVHPAIKFIFWNTYLRNKTSQTYDAPLLSTELKTDIEYNYVYPPEKPVLKDTIFTRGISFDLYTKSTMDYFNYDTTLIKEFLTEKSYFKISNIETVNNGYFLAKGNFSVKVISLNDTISFENGQFSFITK